MLVLEKLSFMTKFHSENLILECNLFNLVELIYKIFPLFELRRVLGKCNYVSFKIDSEPRCARLLYEFAAMVYKFNLNQIDDFSLVKWSHKKLGFSYFFTVETRSLHTVKKET